MPARCTATRFRSRTGRRSAAQPVLSSLAVPTGLCETKPAFAVETVVDVERLEPVSPWPVAGVRMKHRQRGYITGAMALHEFDEFAIDGLADDAVNQAVDTTIQYLLGEFQYRRMCEGLHALPMRFVDNGHHDIATHDRKRSRGRPTHVVIHEFDAVGSGGFESTDDFPGLEGRLGFISLTPSAGRRENALTRNVLG